jgi:hypothetical protein
MRIGSSAVRARSVRHAVRPSITGIITSRITRSAWSAAQAATASARCGRRSTTNPRPAACARASAERPVVLGDQDPPAVHEHHRPSVRTRSPPLRATPRSYGVLATGCRSTYTARDAGRRPAARLLEPGRPGPRTRRSDDTRPQSLIGGVRRHALLGGALGASFLGTAGAQTTDRRRRRPGSGSPSTISARTRPTA